MKTLNKFDNIINVLKNMKPEKKAELIRAHQEFHKLKLYCELKGEIEILPQLTGIRVIKNTQKVKELKAVVEYLKPAGFKWEEK